MTLQETFPATQDLCPVAEVGWGVKSRRRWLGWICVPGVGCGGGYRAAVGWWEALCHLNLNLRPLSRL